MVEASRVQKLLIEQNNEINRLRNRIEQLEAALREIASGRYSGMVLTSMPPKDPAVERARAALEGKKDE